jgi:ribonuclease D
MYHRNGENGAVDNIKVHYCESKATMERVCTEYFQDQDVIGLDLEWMAYSRTADGPRRNVSLIQIASPSRIALFHIAVFKPGADFVPPSFRKIMENPKVSKVGVNIGPDCTRLKNHLGVNVQGIFELSHLYRIVKHFPHERRLIHKGLVSLATQVQDQLLLPLYKGEVRTGNWMRRLNPQQIDCMRRMPTTLPLEQQNG